jgi:uncharacterized damage-inducible protein DinB
MPETLISAPLAGYPPEVGEALWRLEDTRRRTLRLLHDLPASFVDTPTTGNTVGTILYHIAGIEADWLFVEILEEPFPDEVKMLLPADTRDESGLLTFIRDQTLEQHLERLNTIRAILLDRLRDMTVEEFYRPRHLPNYDVSPAWVLHHLAQHEAEHRGELGSILARLQAGSSPDPSNTTA